MDVRNSIIFDELSEIIDGIFGGVVDEFARLSEIFNSMIDLLYDIGDIPLLTLEKKKLKFKKPSYQMNYIQPQIRLRKYLPYQRRVY